MTEDEATARMEAMTARRVAVGEHLIAVALAVEPDAATALAGILHAFVRVHSATSRSRESGAVGAKLAYEAILKSLDSEFNRREAEAAATRGNATVN